MLPEHRAAVVQQEAGRDQRPPEPALLVERHAAHQLVPAERPDDAEGASGGLTEGREVLGGGVDASLRRLGDEVLPGLVLRLAQLADQDAGPHRRTRLRMAPAARDRKSPAHGSGSASWNTGWRAPIQDR